MSRGALWGAAVVGVLLSGCSLLLDFNPKKRAPCTNVLDCLSGEACVAGFCEPSGTGGGAGGMGGGGASGCGGVVCLANQECVAGVCVNSGCAQVSCAATETCVGGGCYPTTCAGLTCAQGAVCDNGACVATTCAGVPCPSGHACAVGECRPTDCAGVACPAGQVCYGAQCLDTSCAGLTCPGPGLKCSGGACEACASAETACSNGVDDDCDGKKDCEDSECTNQACTDGNECTAGEKCTSGGTCGGGNPVVCNSPGMCQKAAGSCNATTGKCVYEPVDAGSVCDDGNPCTTGDVCTSGMCTGKTKSCLSAPGGGCFNSPGLCNVQDGGCTYTAKAAGAACSDGNACTLSDTCSGTGSCIGLSPKVCPGPPNTECYNAGSVCSPSTGACGLSPKVAGTACNDGNACTLNDTCDGAGACSPGAAKTCSPPECKSAGTCNPATGVCSFGNVANGTACTTSAAQYCRPNWCIDGACVPGFARPDGTAWFLQASARCCGGVAVDIATNPSHCGGCYSPCGSGTCQTVSDTPLCSSHPAGTSGRCTCLANSNCPRGQICRVGYTPYQYVCTPNGGANCFTGSFTDLSSCPNYCNP